MKLVIVSGLSGSGKSIALQVLEDLEYYCIDNLPINMLSALSKEIILVKHEFVAIGIDARNFSEELEAFPEQIKQLKNNNISCEIFFLEANNHVLTHVSSFACLSNSNVCSLASSFSCSSSINL